MGNYIKICKVKDMEKENKSLVFNTRQECEAFLTKLFGDVSNEDDYNIFLHQIYAVSYEREDRNLSLSDRISGIMKNGVSSFRYPSITETTRFAGVITKDDCVEKTRVKDLIDYCYYNTDDKYICILAIPKYVYVNGEKVEFSSFQDVAGFSAGVPQDLRDAYAKVGKTDISAKGVKYSLMDAIYSDCADKHLVLGILHVKEKENHYGILLSNEHLFNNQDEKQKYNHNSANKIQRLFEQYKTNDVAKVIAGEWEKEKYYLDCKTMEDID